MGCLVWAYAGKFLWDKPLKDITVALGRDEALSSWRRQALLTLAVVLGLFLAIALIGWRLTAAMRLRSRAECSLVSAREELLDANRGLEVLAAQDQLTGRANRRRFDEVLEREARRAAREGTPLSLLLIDLDYFKGYNDAYGHVAGDACLQAVCSALAQAVQRPGDMAARYGGGGAGGGVAQNRQGRGREGGGRAGPAPPGPGPGRPRRPPWPG